MFNAVIPLTPPVIAVQVDSALLDSGQGEEFLQKMKAFFMCPVVLVAWDEQSKFRCLGHDCPEADLISEDLHWREFEAPTEPEVPF